MSFVFRFLFCVLVSLGSACMADQKMSLKQDVGHHGATEINSGFQRCGKLWHWIRTKRDELMGVVLVGGVLGISLLIAKKQRTETLELQRQAKLRAEGKARQAAAVQGKDQSPPDVAESQGVAQPAASGLTAVFLEIFQQQEQQHGELSADQQQIFMKRIADQLDPEQRRRFADITKQHGESLMATFGDIVQLLNGKDGDAGLHGKGIGMSQLREMTDQQEAAGAAVEVPEQTLQLVKSLGAIFPLVHRSLEQKCAEQLQRVADRHGADLTVLLSMCDVAYRQVAMLPEEEQQGVFAPIYALAQYQQRRERLASEGGSLGKG